MDKERNGMKDKKMRSFAYLHSTTKTKHQVKGRLLLNVVVRQSTSILKLLAGEDKTLLVRGDTLLVLDLGLHRLNGVG